MLGAISPLTAGSSTLLAIGATVGLKNNYSNSNYVFVYPNPTNGLFTIDISSLSEIFITNVLGESILSEKFISGKHNMDIQNQPAGVYFVKICSNKEQQTIKIIKQ